MSYVSRHDESHPEANTVEGTGAGLSFLLHELAKFPEVISRSPIDRFKDGDTFNAAAILKAASRDRQLHLAVCITLSDLVLSRLHGGALNVSVE